MQLDSQNLRANIHLAFAKVVGPSTMEAMLLPRFTGEDAYEMAAAFLGRKWEDLALDELFHHRESLPTLSAEGFRAYLPAYLEASLIEDDKLGPDLRQYLVMSLGVLPHHGKERKAETTMRLSLLNPEQRAVVIDVLRYLAANYGHSDVETVLREFMAGGSKT